MWLWVEKENLHTDTLIRIIGELTKCNKRTIGVAGRKDKLAVSRQWLCLPADKAGQLPDAGESHGGSWCILNRVAHNYPLRLGQLQGNRFKLRLADADCSSIEQQLADLQQQPLLNCFGPQRFGHQGHNLKAMQAWSAGRHQECIDILAAEQRGDAGLMHSLLQAQRHNSDPQEIMKHCDKSLRQYLASVAQSHIFNCVARGRVAAGLLQTVREGDLLLRSGKSAFHVRADELKILQAELESGLVAATAPLPGSKVRQPGPAIDAEERAWAKDAGISWDLFDRGSLFASPGERRRITLHMLEPLVFDRDKRELRFALAAGSFATVVMEALAVTDPRRNVE
jgi:tRNA pseudouridine13 synthase